MPPECLLARRPAGAAPRPAIATLRESAPRRTRWMHCKRGLEGGDNVLRLMSAKGQKRSYGRGRRTGVRIVTLSGTTPETMHRGQPDYRGLLVLLDSGSALVFIRTHPQKAAEGTAAFSSMRRSKRVGNSGRAPDGQNLETGPRRWRIGSHNGGDRFICGGSFAANEEQLPV